MLAVFIFFAAAHARGGEDTGFMLKTGIRGQYAGGMSKPSSGMKLSLEAGYSFEFAKIYPGIFHFIHAQFADGAGGFLYADTTLYGATLSVTPFKVLDITASYKSGTGGADYRAAEMSGDATLEISRVTLSASIAQKKESYSVDALAIKTTLLTGGADISLALTKRFSLDAAYEYASTEFTAVDSRYTKQFVRGGFSFMAHKAVFLAGSAGAGSDSAGYTILGADASLSITLLPGLSLRLFYMYSYYFAPVETVTASGGAHGGPGSGGGMTNPYISTSLAGESFAAQSVSAGISYSY